MRVCGGIWQGMPLAAPKGQSTRPTSAKAREAMGSALRGLIPNARVLDLFAGSGAISFELISLGATEAVMVDNQKAAIQAIKKNVQEAERRSATQGCVLPKISYYFGQVQDWQKWLRMGPFDLIWADPPYGLVQGIAPELLQFGEKALGRSGTFVVESDRSLAPWLENLVAQKDQWQMVKQYTYGQTAITRLLLKRACL